jgi:hypothetical protein
MLPSATSGKVGATPVMVPAPMLKPLGSRALRQTPSSSSITSARAVLPTRSTSSVGVHAVGGVAGEGAVPAVLTGMPPIPRATSSIGQRQTRDSGAFTRRVDASIAEGSSKALTASKVPAVRIDAQTQQRAASHHRFTTNIKQAAKPTSHSTHTPLSTETAPRKRERTSLYAPTASSLAKARSKDTSAATVPVPLVAKLGRTASSNAQEQVNVNEDRMLALRLRNRWQLASSQDDNSGRKGSLSPGPEQRRTS